MTLPRRFFSIPRLILALWTLLAFQRPAEAAPEYAVSGYATQLEQVKLAETPMGPISALDVLMYDAMTSNLFANVPVTTFLNPESARAGNYVPRILAVIEDMTANWQIAQQAGAWTPPEDYLRARSFGAAVAVYAESAARPLVKVEETDIDRFYLAHPERYLRRRQAQVRYIFRAVKKPLDTAQMQEALNWLGTFRSQIISGRFTFPEAAERSSQAASGKDGGLIPPFYDGTYFEEFDAQTFALEEPGQISEPFAGPGGGYLIQLVERQPEGNIPMESVAESIREELNNDLVRHYYGNELRKLQKENFTQAFASWWPYLNPDAPIARVGEARLERSDYFRYFGDPTDTNYDVDVLSVGQNTGSWIEGETVMQELERTGQANHAWIARARELAAIAPRVAHVNAANVSPTIYATPEIALSSLLQSPAFTGRLRSAYIVEIKLETDLKGAPTAAERMAAQALTTRISRGIIADKVPTEPVPFKISTWVPTARAALDTNDMIGLNGAVETLRNTMTGTEWPYVNVSVNILGWQPVIPGSMFWTALKDVPLGQTNRQTSSNSPLVSQYIVIAEKPVDLEPWLKKPLHLQTLAFAAEGYKTYTEKLEALQAENAVTLNFDVSGLRVPSRLQKASTQPQ